MEFSFFGSIVLSRHESVADYAERERGVEKAAYSIRMSVLLSCTSIYRCISKMEPLDILAVV